MRARHKQGSIVLDRRRSVWNYLYCDQGHRRTVRIGTMRQYPSKSAARAAAEVLRVDLRKAIEALKWRSSAPTVGCLVEGYKVEKMPTRYSTRRSYEVWIDNYIMPRWGECSITELQARPVELWLHSLSLAPRSKTGIRGILRLLWDFGQWRGDVPTQRNPMELVAIKGATKRARQPRSLTVEEFQKFIEHLEGRFCTIALVSVSFGLRISEALALRWSDIDWLNGTLSIQRAIVRQRLDEVKTIYSERKMPVDAAMLNVLKVWKQSAECSSPDDWVFPSPVQLGRLPWSADAVNDAYQKAAAAAGIGHVSSHTMRHTFRSWLDATGASITVQKQLMRHSSIKTTMDVYGSIVTDELAKASSRVAELAVKRLQTDCSSR